MGFKDFESKVKDVRVKLAEDHREAVEQSITPMTDENDTVPDSR